MNARRKKLIVSGLRCAVAIRVEEAANSAIKHARTLEGNTLRIEPDKIKKPMRAELDVLVRQGVLDGWAYTVENTSPAVWQVKLQVNYGSGVRDFVFQL